METNKMEENKQNELNFIIEQQEDKIRIYEKEILKLIYEKCLLEEKRDNLENGNLKTDEKNQFIKIRLHNTLSALVQIESFLIRKNNQKNSGVIIDYVKKLRKDIEAIVWE